MAKKKKSKKKTTTVKKQKGLNGWQIAAIVFLILLFVVGMALLIAYLTKLKQSNDTNKTNDSKPSDDKEEEKKPEVKVDDDKPEEKPTSEDINITPKTDVEDKSGEKFTVDLDIKTSDNYNLSPEAKIAIELETKGIGNPKVTINGIQTNGGFKVENNTISFYDLKGKPHTSPVNGANITYNGSPLNNKVVPLMDAINVDSNGALSVKKCDVFVSSNSSGTSADVIYKLNGTDIEFSTKSLTDISVKDGVYYSGNTQLSDSYQTYLSNYYKTTEITPPIYVNTNAPETNLENSQSQSNQV